MHYRNIASLNAQLAKWAQALPRDLEVVVGIPRSGLLAANLLALHRQLPLTDVRGLLEGRLLSAGRRLGLDDPDAFLAQPRRVLVLDDSLFTGGQMEEVRRTIAEARLPHRVEYAAVYVTPETTALVDHYCESMPFPRCFEWNVMHNSVIRRSCVDVDGVLCRDPTPEENDDGPRYQRFLAEAEPLYVPSLEVGWLVTCRLEKYRQATEAWLARHGIEYRELIMMGHPDMESRRAAGDHAEFKARTYRQTDADLFVESSLAQARLIAVASGKPVLCIETQEVLTLESLGQGSADRIPAPNEPQTASWGAKAPGAHLWEEAPFDRSLKTFSRQRAYHEGMLLGLRADDPAPRWFGVPRWLLRQWCEKATRLLACSVPGRGPARRDATREYSYVCGMIRGARIANRKRAKA